MKIEKSILSNFLKKNVWQKWLYQRKNTINGIINTEHTFT